MKDFKVAMKMLRTKQSATKRGIKFDISFRKMKQLMTRKTCYYTGVRFNDKNIRSIDRVDNSKGYFDDNVVVCTAQINGIKANISIKSLNNLTKKVNNFLNK